MILSSLALSHTVVAVKMSYNWLFLWGYTLYKYINGLSSVLITGITRAIPADSSSVFCDTTASFLFSSRRAMDLMKQGPT